MGIENWPDDSKSAALPAPDYFGRRFFALALENVLSRTKIKSTAVSNPAGLDDTAAGGGLGETGGLGGFG
jgi:hypothetical protein